MGLRRWLRYSKWHYSRNNITNGKTSYTAKFEIKYKVNVSNNFNGGKFSTDGQEYNNTTQTGIDFPGLKILNIHCLPLIIKFS